MSGSITTGTNDQGDGNNYANAGWFVAIAAFLLAPVAAVAGVATWGAFSYLRIRRSVIALGLLAYMILAIILSPIIIGLFFQAWQHTVPGIIGGKIQPVPGFLLFVVQQAPLTLPIGVAGGLIYASYRWVRRPAWEEIEFRITPWEIRQKRRTIEDIKNDLNGPGNGVTLGVTEYGRRVVQTDDEQAAHTIIVGGSNTGKTTTMVSRARDAIRRGQGMIFIDLKGGNDIPEIMHKLALRYNRPYKHWLMQSTTAEYHGPDPEGPAYYDPLARGEATRRKDLVIASRDWSEEHYKIQASSYLQMLFTVLINNERPNSSTFSYMVDLLNPKYLAERAAELGTIPALQNIVRGIEEMVDSKMSATKTSAIEGLKSQMEVILHSVAGPWLQIDPRGNHNINLFKAAHEGEIIVFSLDSSNYQELSTLVANLIIQDLKTVTSELRDDPLFKPVNVYIDEFSSIGSDNIIGLINKSRDAKMPVTLATQALGDLRKVSPTFMDQLLGIINSFIVHRANTEDDAEVYAGITGKVWKKKFRQSVTHTSGFFGIGRGQGTGTGTVEEVEEFQVMPTEIQQLGRGEHIYVTKSPSRIEHVRVIQEAALMTGSSQVGSRQVVTTVKTVEAAEEASFVPAFSDGVGRGDSASYKPRFANPYPEGMDAPILTITKPAESTTPAKPSRYSELNFNQGLNRRPPAPARAEPVAPTVLVKQDVVPASKPAFPSTAAPKPAAPKSTSPSRPQIGQAAKPSVTRPRPVPPTTAPTTKSESQKPINPSTPKPPRKKDDFEF